AHASYVLPEAGKPFQNWLESIHDQLLDGTVPGDENEVQYVQDALDKLNAVSVAEAGDLLSPFIDLVHQAMINDDPGNYNRLAGDELAGLFKHAAIAALSPADDASYAFLAGGSPFRETARELALAAG